MVAEDWRPTATREALARRARVNGAIRGFFAERGVLEVETPIASTAGTTDPNIASWSADDGRGARWLRTSPELAIKRLLAAGIGDCYELGRVFRRGESGRRHNPEFTMLEWYRLGIDHHALMDEVQALVERVAAAENRRFAFTRVSHRALFIEHAGIDPATASVEALHDSLSDFGICTDGLSREDWLDLVLTHRVEPALGQLGAVFVYDFPAAQAALARVRRDAGGHAVAERFELYLDGVEIANGYHELTDPHEQRERFTRDLALRRERGAPLPAQDERFLAALDHGMPRCAGVALGVDRLLMVLAGTRDITEVLAFPADRA